jgi:endonuclease III
MASRTRQVRGEGTAYGYPTADRVALVAKAREVTRRVVARHGAARFSSRDPLSMLVNIILSHRTKKAENAAAYRALKERFGSWEGVRDAPAAEVEAAITPVNWPELKAPRIQAILRRITAERGELSLDFLCDLPVEEGTAWLGRLEGVGPKTVACVLLFSCRKPILPVDTHVRRTSIRLGLIGPKVTAEAAHPLLQALLPNDAQAIYDYHWGLLRHGQYPCVYGTPRCRDCFLTDLCDFYQGGAHAGRRGTGKEATPAQSAPTDP